jgi:hypothetical protein
MPDDICGVIIAAFTGKKLFPTSFAFFVPRCSAGGLPPFCCALEKVLSHHGAPTAKRFAGAAELLLLSAAFVA